MPSLVGCDGAGVCGRGDETRMATFEGQVDELDSTVIMMDDEEYLFVITTVLHW